MERKPLNSSEEIDLLYFFRQLGNGIRYAGRGLENYLRLLWRNKILFLLIVLLVTGAAYSVRFFKAPLYRTDGIFISHFLPANYYHIMVGDLNQLLGKEGLPILSEQLKVTPEIAGQIAGLDLEPLRDTILERNDSVFAPFRITIYLREISHLDTIQTGLVFYLEGGEGEQKRKLEREKSLEEAKLFLYEKVMKTDSSSTTGSPTSLKKQAGSGELSAYQELMRVNDLLYNQDKIEVVRPFLKRPGYNYPDYRNYLIKGFLLSMLLAMILTPVMGKRRATSK